MATDDLPKMDRLERKRGFSQVSQIARNALPARQSQVPKTVTSPSTPSPGFESPTWLKGSNKENNIPLEINSEHQLTREADQQPNFYYPAGLTPFPPQLETLAFRDRPLQALTKLQQDVSQVSRYASSPAGTDPFAPGIALDLLSPVERDVLASIDSRPDFDIFEGSLMLVDLLTPPGPLTPSRLNMQDLSLGDVPERSLPDRQLRPVVKQNRASVHMVPTSDWSSDFDDISLNAIIIVFAKGKEAVKVDKFPLCVSSRFFANMLDSPFLQQGQIRVIRLRDDFPWAIKAMTHFIDTGDYTFQPAMKSEHPNITVLDLHIHTYVVGAKYDIPQLCSHAMMQYLNLAQMCLSMETKARPTQTSPFTIESAKIILDQLLDSFVLLWRNTSDRHDMLRAEVLELIKQDINRLVKRPAFVRLMSLLENFGADIMASLNEDGFEVAALQSKRGGIRWARGCREGACAKMQ
ncbi:hypothetical protein EK21DRAFT_111433 [Setomelanomma holmii]|uniref:BTB domain-containing protein n=1 Tax=Setomelanomma holmii TaxID=210430 RepID=A0A9P4HC43_9PLEO|nr:hypothetical protein EK21DRAFT_111433 [Setomelanomma holmii]